MAEPNSSITNVLAAAIAVTAIGTGGEPRSDMHPGDRSAMGTNVQASQSVHSEPDELLLAWARPQPGVAHARRPDTRRWPEPDSRQTQKDLPVPMLHEETAVFDITTRRVSKNGWVTSE